MTPRWAKLNVPVAGTVIAIVGRPHSMTGSNGSGFLIVTVEDIVYNPGTTHVLADSKEDTGGLQRRLQVRKRKRAIEEPQGTLRFFTLTSINHKVDAFRRVSTSDSLKGPSEGVEGL